VDSPVGTCAVQTRVRKRAQSPRATGPDRPDFRGAVFETETHARRGPALRHGAPICHRVSGRHEPRRGPSCADAPRRAARCSRRPIVSYRRGQLESAARGEPCSVFKALPDVLDLELRELLDDLLPPCVLRQDIGRPSPPACAALEPKAAGTYTRVRDKCAAAALTLK
jgi:hypothetical protein